MRSTRSGAVPAIIRFWSLSKRSSLRLPLSLAPISTRRDNHSSRQLTRKMQSVIGTDRRNGRSLGSVHGAASACRAPRRDRFAPAPVPATEPSRPPPRPWRTHGATRGRYDGNEGAGGRRQNATEGTDDPAEPSSPRGAIAGRPAAPACVDPQGRPDAARGLQRRARAHGHGGGKGAREREEEREEEEEELACLMTDPGLMTDERARA